MPVIFWNALSSRICSLLLPHSPLTVTFSTAHPVPAHCLPLTTYYALEVVVVELLEEVFGRHRGTAGRFREAVSTVRTVRGIFVIEPREAVELATTTTTVVLTSVLTSVLLTRARAAAVAVLPVAALLIVIVIAPVAVLALPHIDIVFLAHVKSPL